MPQVASRRAHYDWLLSLSDADEQTCPRAECEVRRNPLNVIGTLTSLVQRVDLIDEKLQSMRRALKPVDYASLNFLDAFYLHCVLSVSGSNSDENELPAVVSHVARLASTQLLTEEVYTRLRRNSVVIPSVYSSPSAFNIGGSKSSAITYDALRVCWTLAERQGHDVDKPLIHLLRKQLGRVANDDRLRLRTVLIEHECLALICSNLHNIDVRVSVRMEAELFAALQPFFQNFPTGATVILVKQIFINQDFCLRLRNMGPQGAVESVKDQLARLDATVPRFKQTNGEVDKVSDQLLRDSNSTLSAFFCECFL